MSEPSREPVRRRIVLTQISSRAWEHPADRGALVALRKLRGFDTVVRQMSGLFSERALRLTYLGSAIRVDERQFSELHYLLRDVARVLDVDDAVPELYVAGNPVPNAMAIGMKQPFIVLTSGLVELLETEELRFVLAHELGHVISGHAVYRTLLMQLLMVSRVVPLAALGFRVIVAALFEWARKAELSADRAGLLATQDPATAYRVHMQTASGGRIADLDQTSFFEQGREYAEGGDLRDSLLKLLMAEHSTHPFAVVRATELRSWAEGGEYAAYLGGSYPRRDADADAPLSEAARDAARSYGDTFTATGDALGRFLHEAAGVAGSVKTWLDDRLRRED